MYFTAAKQDEGFSQSMELTFPFFQRLDREGIAIIFVDPANPLFH